MIRRAIAEGLHWMIVFGVILGAALYLSVPADADGLITYREHMYADALGTTICGALAADPSPEMVYALWEAIASEGFTVDNAGDVIDQAVLSWCPRFAPLLEWVANQSRGSLV
jgi:hypothetical protein